MRSVDHRFSIRKFQREKNPSIYDCQLLIENKSHQKMIIKQCQIFLKQDNILVLELQKPDEYLGAGVYVLLPGEKIRRDFTVKTDLGAPEFIQVFDYDSE